VSTFDTLHWRAIAIGVIAMTVVVAASNVLVQYPINDWLTWGAFTYPISFLVTDLCNRMLGPRHARRVVYVGFVVAVALSIWLATPRIALASGTAFLLAQVLDVPRFIHIVPARQCGIRNSGSGKAVQCFLVHALR